VLRLVCVLFLSVFTVASMAQKSSATELIALSGSPKLPSAIAASFSEKALQEGTAWSSHGKDFFFAVASGTEPKLVIDDGSPFAMKHAGAYWYAMAEVPKLDALHSFHYVLNGADFGGSHDVPAFGPMFYPESGVPQGTLSDKLTFSSKIYDGMVSSYWVYVPAGYKAGTPAALMVFQDGHGYLNREVGALNVIDHLIAAGKMPVTICVFTDPGEIAASPGTPTYKFVQAYSEKWNRTLTDSMRSTEYDTVSDRYARFLREDLLPLVDAKYPLRKDAYSRAITGSSSGAIAAFNAAWQQPDQWSRVLSWIGTYVGIQWREDPAILDGGQDYPEKVYREDHRNLRVWLQDGANDMEGASGPVPRYGSWPLGNLKMANALKQKGYDMHLNFGTGTHNGAHGTVTLPESLTWLWRGYDAAKTTEVYQQSPEEKALPVFRVRVVGRPTE